MVAHDYLRLIASLLHHVDVNASNNRDEHDWKCVYQNVRPYDITSILSVNPTRNQERTSQETWSTINFHLVVRSTRSWYLLASWASRCSCRCWLAPWSRSSAIPRTRDRAAASWPSKSKVKHHKKVLSWFLFFFFFLFLFSAVISTGSCDPLLEWLRLARVAIYRKCGCAFGMKGRKIKAWFPSSVIPAACCHLEVNSPRDADSQYYILS